jgi:putative tricarboxylic transport membrane protein
MIIGLGVFGWILRKLEFSLAPVILGVVLGHLFEDNLRRALSISAGDWSILIVSGSSITLYVLAALIVVVPYLLSARMKHKAAAGDVGPKGTVKEDE